MLYAVTFTGVNVTAQQDLFEIVSAADSITILHQVILSQSTEVGDAQEEALSILIKRGQTTGGAGGSVVTPVPLETGSSAFGGTTATNRTTKASAGTIVTTHAEAWNVRGPWVYLPTPEARPILGPSTRMTVELATTPADAITMHGTCIFEELGG